MKVVVVKRLAVIDVYDIRSVLVVGRLVGHGDGCNSRSQEDHAFKKHQNGVSTYYQCNRCRINHNRR